MTAQRAHSICTSLLPVELTGNAVCVDGSHQHERGDCSRYECPPPEQVPHGQGGDRRMKNRLSHFREACLRSLAVVSCVSLWVCMQSKYAPWGASAMRSVKVFVCSGNDKIIVYTHKEKWISIHKPHSSFFSTDCLTKRIVSKCAMLDKLLY